jgi:hypothetical protein
MYLIDIGGKGDQHEKYHDDFSFSQSLINIAIFPSLIFTISFSLYDYCNISILNIYRHS